MPPDQKPQSPERAQTDESLRIERAKTDYALGEEQVGVDEIADAVIARARARADEVLAAARARVDRQPRRAQAPSPDSVDAARSVADQLVDQERADADEAVSEERAQKAATLASEREETDKDLFSERARADDALSTRDAFLGIVSHDLRNLLSTMIGYAALIERKISDENQLEHVVTHAQRIQRSGGRMDRLIGDLVDVASIEAGMLVVTREDCDPAKVVAEAVETFQAQAATNGVSLAAELTAPETTASLDPARILQVLINLIGNAIKFTAPNGAVVVRVERLEDQLLFAISDTGIGIPSDNLDAIFGRFLQVRKNDRRGVGLGLFISKCIVQGHGGRIWAESTVGAGSKFCFTLPLHEPCWPGAQRLRPT